MDINTLLSKYILKILTPEEEEIIKKWSKEDWKNEEYLSRLNSQHSFSQKYNKYKEGIKERRKITLKKYLRFAACILPILVLSTLFIFFLNSSNIVIAPGESKAILFLDNSESFILDSKQKISYININDSIKISNRNGIIDFKNDCQVKSYKIDNTISVPRGCEYKLILCDGTKIHLNSLSTIKFPLCFDSSSRTVELQGEAYFEIAKDSLSPFYVKVNGILVRQYGTEFSVSARSKDKVIVALESGSVAIINEKHHEQMIKPNEIARWSSEDNNVIVSDEDITPYTAWHHERFVFNNNTLFEIMQTLSLWYNVDVTFDNKDIQNLRFTGNLGRYEDMNQILNSIEKIDNIKFRRDKKHISIGYK